MERASSVEPASSVEDSASVGGATVGGATSRPVVSSGEARAQWLEAAWRAGERPFRQMIDALPEAVYITDAEGHLTHFNPAAARFAGRTPELGTDRWCVTWKLYHPDGTLMPHETCPMAVALKEGRSIRGAEAIAERPDGTRIWFEAYPSPLRDEDGQVVGAVNMLVDVTEKWRERRLQEEQARLLELIATGSPLEECLAALCDAVARLGSGVRASIMLADEEHQAFRRSVAPDLSPSWGEGLEGVPIDDLTVGTCGEAVFRGEPVTCEDVASDDRWSKEWRELCVANGVRASHSEPIRSEDGAPLGSLMLCFDEARAPSAWERRLVSLGTHVATIALERHRSQEALRKNEERFRAFVTASSDVVYSMSPDWAEMRFLEGQDFVADMHEPNRTWIDEYIHPDDQKQVMEAINEAIRTKSTFELEHRVLRADSTLGWTFSRAVPILDEEGEIVEWFGAAHDITERKEAEAELARVTAESERQRRLYETIISSTPDLVYVFDLDYRFTFVNDALLEMWGRTLEESIGKTLQEVGYEPWHAKMHKREIDQVVATKQPVRGEAFFPHATLGRRIYDYIFVPVLNDEGEVEAVTGTTRDVTERKRHERKLEDAKAQLEAATEAGAVGTWEWHVPEDRFVAGPTFARLFGVDPDAARDGVPIERFVSSIHEDDRERVEAKINEALASCGSCEAEYRVRNTDSELRWVVARGRVECDEDGSPVTFPGALTDITERKRAEKALQNLTETLEERVEQRTAQVRALFSRLTMAEQQERRRLAEVLHDSLQQRLYGIQMRMTFLRKHVESGAREQLLEETRQAEGWMKEAIATTRQLSVNLHPPVLKKEGLAEALGWLQSQMKELHGLEVDLRAERAARIPDKDMRVFLFQVTRELLFNVVKHAGTDHAAVELKGADDQLLIRVSDDGCGFDPNEVEGRSYDEGFGLTAVRERLELFGGGLEIDSTPGGGACMTAYVPLAPVLVGEVDAPRISSPET